MHHDGANALQMNYTQADVSQPILDGLKAAVLLVGADRRVIFMNPAAEGLLETSTQRGCGQDVIDLVPMGMTLQAALIAAEQGETTTLREEVLRAPIQSEEITVDCTVSPLERPLDGPCIIVELNQVDQLARMTRDTTLQERQDAFSQVVRALAHEIKNPLGGIRGAAQLLDSELNDKNLREYTRIITHETDRLSGLVDRLTGGYRASDREPFNLHSVLEHIRKLTLVETPQGLNFERDYDPSIPEILGDHAQMIQAVLNIVRNAVQAMAGRGCIQLRTRVRRQCTIHHRRHRLVVEASIMDNGPGIEPGLRERIFFPMVTGRHDGTGLGLALAQEIISRHGGLIECASRPGQTTFTILLPVEDGS
jgi:two-component system nitrogen regulation sensor histidine kinase GlnL